MNHSATSIAAEIVDFLKKQDSYHLIDEVASLLQKEAYRSQVISVISALKLSDQEEIGIKKILTDKWGEHPFRFMVDPSLVSGLIVTFQDKVIDQSGRGALSDLHQTLITS